MLCDPVVYTGTQPKLVNLPLSSGQLFSIQHLSVDQDIEELYRQFFTQVGTHWDLSGLLESFKASFQYMAGSHTSQAFIVSIEEQHIFEIEIHKANAHQPQLPEYIPQPGDFIIQISAGGWTRTSSDRYAESLSYCLYYFFQFPEVKRILINSTSMTKDILQNVLIPADFHPLPNHAAIYYHGL